MKCKIIINALEGKVPPFTLTRTEVWSGEMQVEEGIMLLKFSVLAEGETHPICEVPFSRTVGHWKWIPPEMEHSEEVERIGGMAFDEEGKTVET